ncbi:hypothetical protein F5148DRAFT_859155 [Russula earlei]|uniref:Uncharacterized protein n=1 Tax=Russula earlei TaxID=71964 RepID=A0ACC0TS29_9AGAM|nr:hypothetical protein F5148DRAFT_859155 [Russula earlei]
MATAAADSSISSISSIAGSPPPPPPSSSSPSSSPSPSPSPSPRRPTGTARASFPSSCGAWPPQPALFSSAPATLCVVSPLLLSLLLLSTRASPPRLACFSRPLCSLSWARTGEAVRARLTPSRPRPQEWALARHETSPMLEKSSRRAWTYCAEVAGGRL